MEPIVFEELESENPFELGYLQKLKGYSDKYKIRVGDYRIGITIEQETNTLICEKIAHRKDIYQFFLEYQELISWVKTETQLQHSPV